MTVGLLAIAVGVGLALVQAWRSWRRRRTVFLRMSPEWLAALPARPREPWE